MSRKLAMFTCLSLVLLGCRAGADDPPATSARYNTTGGPLESIALSSDGKLLLVGTGGKVGWVLWDVEGGRRLRTGPMKTWVSRALAFSPDGKSFAAGGQGNQGDYSELRVFETATGKVRGELAGHWAYVTQVGFTPDGRHLVSVADDNMVYVWRLADMSPQANFRFTSDDPERDPWKTYRLPEKAKTTVTFPDVIGRLQHFAISPDGQRLAVTTGTRKVRILGLLTGKTERVLTTEAVSYALSVAFSPDGKALAIGGGMEGSAIEVWETATWRRVATLRGHEHSVLCVALSPDGKTLLSGGLLDGLRVWDLPSGKQRYHLYGDGEFRQIAGLAFLPDGKTFAAATYQRPVEFWDTLTGKRVSPVRAKGPKKGEDKPPR